MPDSPYLLALQGVTNFQEVFLDGDRDLPAREDVGIGTRVAFKQGSYTHGHVMPQPAPRASCRPAPPSPPPQKKLDCCLHG